VSDDQGAPPWDFSQAHAKGKMPLITEPAVCPENDRADQKAVINTPRFALDVAFAEHLRQTVHIADRLRAETSRPRSIARERPKTSKVIASQDRHASGLGCVDGIPGTGHRRAMQPFVEQTLKPTECEGD
jgi:hypothetical protein